MSKLTPGAKKGLIGIFAVAIVATLGYESYTHGYWDAIIKRSAKVGKVDLPDAPVKTNGQKVTILPLPSSTPSSKSYVTQATIEGMKWTAQGGLLYAIGGPTTTKGSIAEKNGVKLTFTNIDDQSQSMKDMVAFAGAYKKWLKDTTQDEPTGTNYYVIMGDAGPETMGPLNAALHENVGKDWNAEVVGPIGTSKGEDALWADSSWKSDPNKARGSIIAGVIRDGDWDVAVKWAGDNGDIPINPDPNTYDPNAINFVNCDTYIIAGQKFVSAFEVQLKPIGKDGKLGAPQTYHVNAFVSWTPVDVTVVKTKLPDSNPNSKISLAKIASTKDYNTQMYATIVGIKNWDERHKGFVVNMLKSAYEGADQINSSQDALDQMGVIEAKDYASESGPYWVKYDKGVTEFNTKNQPVDLGGSSQMNLADALIGWGLAPNSTNIYAAVYSTFRKIDLKYYPEVFKDGGIPDVKEIQNFEYLQTLQTELGSDVDVATAAKTSFNTGDVHDVVSQKPVNINFEISSPVLTQVGKSQVDELLKSAIIAGGLRVQVEGYTDNTGNALSNQKLSVDRAQAVADYMNANAPGFFKDHPIIVKGFGGTKQIPGGYEVNRRVVIKLGN